MASFFRAEVVHLENTIKKAEVVLAQYKESAKSLRKEQNEKLQQIQQKLEQDLRELERAKQRKQFQKADTR